MNWISKWFSLGILLIVLLEWGVGRSMTVKEEEFTFFKIFAPSSHVALSGDLAIFIIKTSEENIEKIKVEKSGITSDSFLLRVMYVLDDISESIGEIPVDSLPSKNENVSVIIPCGYFTRGGVYTLRLEYKNSTMPLIHITPTKTNEIETSSILDVKWPTPTILMDSQRFTTYPNKPIMINIKYDSMSCESSKDIPLAVYILQLVYCGPSVITCYLRNDTHTQILYYEEIKGFTSPKIVYFGCELFGLPGNYAIKLKAADANPGAPNTSVYVKVEWSEEFRLTVHARSIYPCDGSGGVAVLFEYPSCRLEGDRVRVYGRLKADVTSMASPSSLRYITELRSITGKHSLTFDCDFFTEKFVEYCFVYVSQAITGAMADVKISCVPTFPFQEGDAAGWGAWSPWSPCSSSCFGGIRNRYRFCDTPPPKYGAQFCQGKAVETEFCSTNRFEDSHLKELNDQIDNPECNGAVLAVTRPEVVAEIGMQCRCGCIITLQEQLSRKILGADTQACPGRSFWLLQAQTNFVIGLHLDQLQFPCPGQYFRARDGDSLNANLLMDIAFNKIQHSAKTVITTGQNLLLEFFSDELAASKQACIGGFLAHAALFDKTYLRKNGTVTVVPFETHSTNTERRWISWNPAHVATASVLILIFFIFIFLTLQFVMKYRKYRIAKDLDNISDTSELIIEESKSISASTIITEVYSVIGVPTKSSSKEALQDVDEQYNSTETLTGYKEESSLNSSTLKLNKSSEISLGKAEALSKMSIQTLLPASCVVTDNQAQVKYAYPVKLQTLDSSSSEEKSFKIGDEKFEDIPMDNLNLSKIYCVKDYSGGKESCPGSLISSPSTLRSGKETKERRNRERLLQGPGSEFSLANPDSELELDYYDYNVANASAVPGSYLGMDPAFLVWIPPIDDSKIITDDFFIGSKRNSILTLETEGTSLSPSEYRRIQLSTLEDFGFHQSEDHLKKTEKILERVSTDSLIREEITGESKIERSLPIKQIFEDCNLKISVDSFSVPEYTPHCIIPNRRILGAGRDDKLNNEANSEVLLDNCTSSSESNENKLERNCSTKKNRSKNLDRTEHSSNQKKSSKEEEKDGSVCRKYNELIECTEPFTSKKVSVDIPMIELTANPLKSITQRMDNKDVDSSLNVQDSDYTMKSCTKQELFFDQNIRFVDDDDDEFVD